MMDPGIWHPMFILHTLVAPFRWATNADHTAGRWVTLIDCVPLVNKIPRTPKAEGVAGSWFFHMRAKHRWP